MSRATREAGRGRLVLAGTPIGDAQDASPALVASLQAADLIAAEDTRLAATLLRRLDIQGHAPIVSYFEGNEPAKTPELVARIEAGDEIVLITDAGMPSVSDPGYRLVRACIDAGVTVTAVPGPSAVLTALALSGLPSDRFCFEGFLARKSGERRRQFEALQAEARTMIFFEAPHRLAEFLTDAAAVLGDDRPAAICRELTKPHEEVIRGGLGELAAWATDGVRGEVTVVIQGAPAREIDQSDALELVRVAVQSGTKMSAAVAEVAQATGMKRRELYELALHDPKLSDSSGSKAGR